MSTSITGYRFKVSDKVMVKCMGIYHGPVEITEYNGIGTYMGRCCDSGRVWYLYDKDLTPYVETQTTKSITAEDIEETPRMMDAAGQDLPKPKEKEIDPKDCKYHQWVTTTMFRFDTTYCKKCGIEKGKE